MKDQPKDPEVKVIITTDIPTADAILNALEMIATDETVDPSGIKNVEVKGSSPELPKGM